MDIRKIDPGLFAVGSLENELISCIVFVNDFSQIEKLLQCYDLAVKYKFPSLKAFAVCGRLDNILCVSDYDEIRYISNVLIASCLINKAKLITQFDKIHNLHILGQGVGVAIIDTGCYCHLDFMLGRKKNVTFVDFINQKECMYDDNGHGTFVSGVLAGSGVSSAKVYSGVAPECNLIVLKALDENGKTQGFKILEAFEWVLSNFKQKKIRVVCLSFGANPLSRFDALTLGAEALWDAGIVVVSAVGNDGPKSESIKSPAISSKIISVGSVDSSDGEIKMADFSSRGPSFNCVKPDIVAPGVKITSLDNSPKLFTQMSGTSVSAPFVAGAATLLLSKFPYLTPNEVKAQIIYNTTPLPFEKNECGMGMLNIDNIFFAKKN